MLASILCAIVVSYASLCLRSWLKRRTQHSPEHCSFPPGPKGLPLVGNIFDMPSSEEWVKAREWGEKYGDLIMVKNFGTRYLFVNSYKAAFDLLEKRGNKYSSRPVIPMFELEEWTWFTAVMPYGEEHRHSRQFLHQFFHQAATSRFHEVQMTSTHKLLLAILENPAKFAEHLHYSAGELIIRIGYGYQAKAKNDPYIELAERALHAATEAEGFFLVNALPILKYLPEWFPGAHFLNTAKIGRELSRQMRSRIFAMAKKLIENGKALTSMTSTLLEQNTDIDGQVTHEDLIARTVGTIYIAGTDTTSSVLVKFIQAMVLYPETMRQGQAELDKVIGMDTLPTMDDRPKLPYINAICKELLRYQPTAPLAIAHYTTEDDYYNGFYIPAGTIILPNVWAMLMDPKTYPEPDKFKPDRWLPSDGAKQPLQSNKMAFGFGRRICPGRHFAEDSIFIQVASILAVFDIQMAVDANGDPIVPKEEYISAFIRKPMPFKCKITPRSDRSAELIQRAIELISPVHETPKAN